MYTCIIVSCLFLSRYNGKVPPYIHMTIYILYIYIYCIYIRGAFRTADMKRIINASYCCADYNNGDSSSTWRQLEEQRQTCGYHILYFVLFAIESFISIMFMLRYIICFILVRQAPGKTIKCSTVRDLNNKTHSVAID